MTTRSLITCDFRDTRGTLLAPCERPARHQVRATTVSRMFTMDVCVEDLAEIERSLAALGFRVQTKAASSKVRNAYITNSGRVYSANEARDWLNANGYNVKPGGRLSQEMHRVYADAN